MRPSIAVTTSYGKESDDDFLLHKVYVRCVEKAGGLPFIVGPGLPDDAVLILDRVAGLLLTGGSDVDSALFGEARHPAVKRVIPERDVFEIALCREAARRDLPILAICRGQQVLNVALGGDLYQDIASQVPGALQHRSETPRHVTSHDVELLPGTRLRSILGVGSVAVNSFHHQAVRSPGRGLVVAARSTVDGIIEGLESHAHRFLLAVQWHPEDFWGHAATFEPLFDELVKTCVAR